MSHSTKLLENPDVAAALGPEEPLTQDQLGLLAILLNPENDPSESAQDLGDMLDALTVFTGTDVSEANTVAGFLREHHIRAMGRYNAFGFELVGDDTGIDSYNVMTGIGDSGTWLMLGADEKHLRPHRQEITGLRAAIDIAETLTNNFKQVLNQLARMASGTT